MQAGTERPRFRQDLFAEEIDEQGAKYIDVMDPDSGKVFRFYEVEFSIACAMDGERDIPGLVRWAQDELGVTPTANEVQTVIATLGNLGYLDMTAAAKAAAADVPATAGLASGASASAETVVDAQPPKVAAARAPIPVEQAAARAPTPVEQAPARAPIPVEQAAARAPIPVEQAPVRAPTPVEQAAARAPTPVEQAPIAAAVPGTTSEVSLDLSEHLAVGREDVKEAVRQSRVMAAVELPPDLAEQPTPPPAPLPVAETQPERPIAVTQPERPIERPVETKQPEVHKQPVELPKVPEKQPVAPPAPARRVSPVVVLLILVVLGVGAFFVWKLVLDKPSQQPTGPVGAAPVQPQPPPQQPPPGPPPKPTMTAKIEMSAGRPKTILSYFAGTIEWIETSGKEAKSNDIIMKLQGYKALEAQVAALTKEVAKAEADATAAHSARDALPAGDEAALKKAQAKVEAAEKIANVKSDLLQKKSDQLEQFYARLTLDGTLTVTRKVGDKLAENTPIATIVPTPAPSATFKIPPELKLEVGTVMALRLGEKIVTCEIADWEPEKLRMTCPPEPGVVEGATVSWQLP